MRPDELLADERGRPARADLLLTGLPPVFVGTYGAGTVALDSLVGAAAAALVCCALVADGLFAHPPENAESQESQ
jgi:hypothetical protein